MRKTDSRFLSKLGRYRVLHMGVLVLLGLLLTACNGLPLRAVGLANAAQSQPAHAKVPGEITHVVISRIHHSSCQTAPVTFGQPFVKGDLPKGQTLHAEYKGHALPTQVNVKARNDDGSARHAVITIQAPCDNGAYVALVAGRGSTPAESGKNLSLQDLIQSHFNSSIDLTAKGKKWQLDARELLEQVRKKGGCRASGIFCKHYLSGSLASEWVVGAPLQSTDGSKQPHLAAYFAVRAYGPPPVTRVRVDVVVENDWAYPPHSTNIEYKPVIRVAGKTAYAPKGFTHYRQARWHKAVWWGKSSEAPLYAALDPTYLQSTPAVPQYENINLSQKMMAHARQDCAPMRSCSQTKHMENTGAQAAIGPLPRWSAAFVINPNYRMYRWMLANTDALGAYGIHYRSQDTGEILSVKKNPCATMVYPARVARCPAPPHGDDRFPHCESKGACKTPLHANESHHPAPAYVAYLATGDWYYMSELTFWTDWVVFWQNPKYRDYATGLVHPTQVRGQAWALRTIGDAAYALPDNAPYKKYFNDVIENNIAWYNKKYTDNPNANALGAVVGYSAVVYKKGGQPRTGIATWQQSFFTWATGNLADQGFAGADKLRDWFSQFAVGTMTAPGYCWEMASNYSVRIRDKRKSPYYKTFAEVYDKSFPKMRDAGCGRVAVNRAIKKVQGKKHFHYPPGAMSGYPKSATGFPANFQIGLAAAANSSLPNATKAWSIFKARSVKPSYRSSPQFAIVPSS